MNYKCDPSWTKDTKDAERLCRRLGHGGEKGLT